MSFKRDQYGHDGDDSDNVNDTKPSQDNRRQEAASQLCLVEPPPAGTMCVPHVAP